MRRFLATTLAATGIAAGAVAIASPAWAACGVSATAPTQGLVSVGTRSGCSTTTTLTVRFAKDQFGPDPYTQSSSQAFLNGSLTSNGDCSRGAGAYYTWVIPADGGSRESGRVGRC